MALHLNLCHEIEKQALQRSRDPLKLGLYGMGLIAALLLVYYFYRVQQVYKITSQAAQLQTKWKIDEPKAALAKLREDELKVNLKLKETLVQRIEGRFYWAPLLERILQTVPRNVQINGFQGTIDADTEQGALNVNGIAAGDEARKAAEDLRTTFASTCLKQYRQVTSKFVSLEDSEQRVPLDGKTLNTSIFSLQFQFSTAPEPPPAPTSMMLKMQKGGR